MVQAINTLLGDKSTYQAQFQQNIAKVIRSAQQNTADGINEKLQELQKEFLKKANNKEAYDEITDEIFKLREQREIYPVDTAARDAQIARINELQDFIKQQPAHLEAYDEALVKRWLARIIVWDDHSTVELKSGLKIVLPFFMLTKIVFQNRKAFLSQNALCNLWLPERIIKHNS